MCIPEHVFEFLVIQRPDSRETISSDSVAYSTPCEELTQVLRSNAFVLALMRITRSSELRELRHYMDLFATLSVREVPKLTVDVTLDQQTLQETARDIFLDQKEQERIIFIRQDMQKSRKLELIARAILELTSGNFFANSENSSLTNSFSEN